MFNYMKPALRDSQEEAPAFFCGSCNGEVYHGELTVLWDGKRLCMDCFKARVKEWLERSPAQVADALGFEYSLEVAS